MFGLLLSHEVVSAGRDAIRNSLICEYTLSRISLDLAVPGSGEDAVVTDKKALPVLLGILVIAAGYHKQHGKKESIQYHTWKCLV